MTTLLSPTKEPKELRPRAAAAAVIAVLMFIVLGARLYHLQMVRGQELGQKGRENYVKEQVEPAGRGEVLDRRGRVLAGNRPSFDVYLTPAFCRHLDDVLGRLSVLLGMTPEEVESVRTAVSKSRKLERFRGYLVKQDIGHDVYRLDEELSQLEGVDVIKSPHRRYCPFVDGEERCAGALLSHVVGYMSEVSQAELDREAKLDKEGKLPKEHVKYRRGDFLGRRGIERALESELRGQDGKRRITVDAKGRPLGEEVDNALIDETEKLVPPVPGHDVVLSIDLALQTIADRALTDAGKAGAIVVVDVHTGFVLAMVSHPSYDANMMTGRISRKDLQELVDDPMEPLFQRAVQNHYHPGSTFKVVTALAALEKGVVGPENSTSCGGGYSLGARRWRCHKDSGHGGGINLRRGLMLSCDTYFYWLADRMGLDPIADMGARLGFGKTTGIEIAPEAAGLMPTVAFHDRVDRGYTKGFALNAAIGQGSVNVTPLQLAMAYAAIANGGTLYRPKLVRRIQDSQGGLLREQQPEVVRRIDLKPAQYAAVMDGLTSVVAEPGGTAYSKRLVDVTVAGKTGTAQNVVIGKERTKKEDMPWEDRDHAWFAGVAPAEAPEIVVVVVNEHGGHGGAAAAPAAMAVIEGYFDLKKEEAQAPLAPAAIARLEPAPRYAQTLYARREREREEATARAAAEAGFAPLPPDEPVAPTDAVADPSLLRGQEKKTGPGSTGADEARPSPE